MRDNVNVKENEMIGGSAHSDEPYWCIQSLIQEYRSKISVNESVLTIKILNSYEKLLQLFNQKVDMINQIWDVNESEKYQLAQEVLDPLEQTLYSSL